MNAEGRVKAAISSLAWHETYPHSRNHPELMRRMREYTARAEQELKLSEGKPYFEARRHKQLAKEWASKAKDQHKSAMLEYQRDATPELLVHDLSNCRKIAAQRVRTLERQDSLTHTNESTTC